MQDRRAAPPLRVAAAAALRKLAVCVLAGALLGLLVGGAGGRLAMMLLAVLNPEATGVVSDDGFRIGQLTRSGTVNLLMTGVALGVMGGMVYNVVRPLLVGPRWFQVLSVGGGPAIVVGAILVHVDGVDFTTLQPAWLGIVLFVVVPGLYAALLTVVVEWWLAPEAWPARLPVPLQYAPLLILLPVAAIVAPFASIWLAVWALRRNPDTDEAFRSEQMLWVWRGLLVVPFALALVDLVRDTLVLT